MLAFPDIIDLLNNLRRATNQGFVGQVNTQLLCLLDSGLHAIIWLMSKRYLFPSGGVKPLLTA